MDSNMIILDEWNYKLILEKQKIPDILLLKPTVNIDDRGYFIESFRQSIFEDIGRRIIFVQENIVSTKNSGVIRGLHYQLSMPQGKLIHVISGEILDVAVDIRQGSPYFGQHVTINLNSNNLSLILEFVIIYNSQSSQSYQNILIENLKKKNENQ